MTEQQSRQRRPESRQSRFMGTEQTRRLERISEVYGATLLFTPAEDGSEGGYSAGDLIVLGTDQPPALLEAAFFHELGHVMQCWLHWWLGPVDPNPNVKKIRPKSCPWGRFGDGPGRTLIAQQFAHYEGRRGFRYDRELQAWHFGIMLARLHGFRFSAETFDRCDAWLESYIDYEKEEYIASAFAEIEHLIPDRPRGELKRYWYPNPDPQDLVSVNDPSVGPFRWVLESWAAWQIERREVGQMLTARAVRDFVVSRIMAVRKP